MGAAEDDESDGSQSPTDREIDARAGIPWAALRPFESYHPAVHGIALAGVLLLWWVLYLACFRFGVVAADPLATGAEARAARRLAGGIAGAGTGVVLGAATMRRFGGPFLNFLLAGLSSVLAPAVFYPVTYGTLLTLYAPASDRLALRTLLATAPGAATFFVGAWLWVRFAWDDDEPQRWRDALPPNPIVQPTEK